MAGNVRVPLEQSALLVIDVQDSFKQRPWWPQRSFPETFEGSLTALIAAFRDHKRPVIYVMHSQDDEAFAFGGPHYRLMSFLDARPNEPIIHKQTANALTSTPLLPLLHSLGVRRLVVTGIQTEQCCETTTRVASDMGFDVDFVTEATMTFPIAENRDGSGCVLTTNEIIERTEFVLRHRFARIATVDEIVAEFGAPVPA